jgi:hypothetical protein
MQDIEAIVKILEAQADMATQRPVKIPFKADDESMVPKGVDMSVIIVSPLKVGTVFRIKSLLAKIPKEDIDAFASNSERSFDPSAPELFEKYATTIFEALVLAIHNKKTDPPAWMREFLQENCTWADVHVILNAVLFRLGNRPFSTSTTTLMKAVGPIEEKEMIAFSTNLQSWKGR